MIYCSELEDTFTASTDREVESHILKAQTPGDIYNKRGCLKKNGIAYKATNFVFHFLVIPNLGSA